MPEPASKELKECRDYIEALIEADRIKSVSEMLVNVSFVYLSRKERIAIVWRIMKILFR